MKLEKRTVLRSQAVCGGGGERSNFPEQCRYVLETLGEVYGYDGEARDRGLTSEERLQFPQEHSGPGMETHHQWLEGQFAEPKTEPNSGVGKAINYLLRHWKALSHACLPKAHREPLLAMPKFALTPSIVK